MWFGYVFFGIGFAVSGVWWGAIMMWLLVIVPIWLIEKRHKYYKERQ
jgi:hypothetical protein